MFSCCRPREERFDFLIVGGGVAAGYACAELVKNGVTSNIGLVHRESVPPYERPALTKAYLHPPGAKVRARLPGFYTQQHTTEWYDENMISLIRGEASAVDLKAKTVQVDGRRIGYVKLILATGSRSRRMADVSGSDLEHVFHIRELQEAKSLVDSLEALQSTGDGKAKAAKALVVGGGVLGMECAAAFKGWGLDTAVVMPSKHCLARMLNEPLGKWFEQQYTSRGVEMIHEDTVSSFVGEKGKVTGAKLKSGKTVDCNLVVVAVGAEPNIEWCTGLKMAKGIIEVDASLRTSDANVFAVGDICAFPGPDGDLRRLEQVEHARASAAHAARAALGLSQGPYTYTPHGYTRVFEYGDSPVQVHIYGETKGECKMCIFEDKSLGAAWFSSGKLAGALLMGSPGPSPEALAKLKDLASGSSPVSGTVVEVFESLGMSGAVEM